MAQKNEVPVLILALLVTAGLIGGGAWWVSRNFQGNLLQGGTPTGSSTSSSGSVSGGQGFAGVQNVPTGLFNYGGSTVWATIRLVVDGPLQAARPEFRLRYVDPGSKPPSSSEGIRMLLSGELAFAQSSRPISDPEYSQAKQRGFQLQQIPVAIDGLAIAVHPSLPISGLTLSQLKAIYTGKVTNWSQVNGPDLAITPYAHLTTAGTPFEEKVLGDDPLGANVRAIATTTEAIRILARDPGGIFYASAPQLVPQCTVKAIAIGTSANALVPPYQEPFVPLQDCPNRRNQLNAAGFQQGTYPITRSLFVVVKENGRIEQQAGEAYANFLLTDEGQALIAKAGFIRIR